MNMVEFPRLVASDGNLIGLSSIDKNKTSLLKVRMNGLSKTKSGNVDSSASSTSRSHSSGGGLLIKRSKTSNTLSQDGRLSTLFEQRNNSLNFRLPKRPNNRSEYSSTNTGPTRSNFATAGSRIGSKRCVSSNDLTKMDTTLSKSIVPGGLSRHKSEQQFVGSDTKKKSLEKPLKKRVQDDNGEDDKERDQRILNWLYNVEQYAEPPPELAENEHYDDSRPPQTDTAIHIVYEGHR